jgi:tetratricopeptide (TPR) repeat protein
MLAGLVALEAGDLAKAQQYLEHALTLAPDNGLIHDAATIQVNLGLLYLVQGNLAEAEDVLRTSYAHAEPLQQVRSMGFIQAALGFIGVLRGEPAQAAPLLRDALHNLVLVRETTFLLMGLLVCCGLAVLQQQPLRAVMLFAGTVRYAATVGLALSPVLLTAVQMQIEQARAQVSTEEFDRAQLHGQSLSLDEVIALAQSLVESP